MPVFAHCPSCGLDFESRLFANVNVTRTTISDIDESCPRCGGIAWVMEGTFNADRHSTVVLSGPQRSRELVARMQARFREIDKIASSSRIDDGQAGERIREVLAEVESVDPVLAAEFRSRTEGQPRRTWSPAAKAITAALAVIGGYNTIADFSDRVAELITYFSQ